MIIRIIFACISVLNPKPTALDIRQLRARRRLRTRVYKHITREDTNPLICPGLIRFIAIRLTRANASDTLATRRFVAMSANDRFLEL